jgi:hypothetical protein
MAYPIKDVRALWGELNGTPPVAPAGPSAPGVLAPLSPAGLLEAMRARSTVIVPVGAGLRTASWIGMLLSAVTAFASPWLVDAWASVDDIPFPWIVFCLDRGDTWTLLSGGITSVGFVSMVFTNAGTRAERFGLHGLAITAVGGCVLGAPTLVGLLIGLVSVVVMLAFFGLLTWLFVGGLASWND